MKKQCAHTHADYDTLWRGLRVMVMGCYAIVRNDPHFGYGEHRVILSARCFHCGTQLPLGLADDDSSNVQEEIEAAWYALRASLSLTSEVRWGWDAHFMGEDPPHLGGISWRAGWLARELATHDYRNQRDADAWPWDPARPVAGQREEWLARGDAKLAEPTCEACDTADGCEEHHGVEVEIAVGPTDEELLAEIASTPRRPPLADLICNDEPGEQVDPATKFGELAHQLEVPVSSGDTFMRRAARMEQLTSVGCPHVSVTQGADIRNNRWHTDVCRDCGAFRMVGEWRPADEYSEATDVRAR